MNLRAPALFALLVTALPAQAVPPIELHAEIDVPPAKLFALWTTTAGVRTVFPGADARIDGKVGGDYCVLFAPDVDPAGDKLGTNGCRIRELARDQRLVFEWKGTPDQPALSVRPFPTAVTLTFAPLPGERTRLDLVHAGFPAGTQAGRDYFDGAWRHVLDGLVDRFAKAPPVPPELLAQPRTTLFVVQMTPGPAWQKGKDAGEQPGILNHFLYMMRLQKEGRLLMGGRYGEQDGLGLLTVPDRATAERLVAADPAVQAGLFVPTVRPWTTVLPKALRDAGADAPGRDH